MRKTMKVAMAGVFALAAGTMAFAQGNPSVVLTPQTQPAQAQAAARRIDRATAQKLVSEGKAIYVDVRSAEQYALGHIKGAVSIPFSELMTRFREIPAGKMIVTYCACVEEHTAAAAVVDLNAHGVKNTAALLGGWNEWNANHLPVESGASMARKPAPAPSAKPGTKKN